MIVRLAAIPLLFITLICLSAPCQAQAADYPKITFEYGDLFDRFCADATKKTVEPNVVKELETKLETLRAHWQKEAPQLYQTTLKLTKAPFEFGEAKAALSLCSPGSLSFPLIINVRPYLQAINGERTLPLANFAATVFHETLHRYVNDRKASLPGKTTPLLTKYQNEPAPVRNHIHLFAILDEVYRRLGRQKDFEQIIAFEETLSSAPIFRRAREIIKTEGIENVICEISKDGCRRSSNR